jgi:hypothetical protein
MRAFTHPDKASRNLWETIVEVEVFELGQERAKLRVTSKMWPGVRKARGRTQRDVVSLCQGVGKVLSEGWSVREEPTDMMNVLMGTRGEDWRAGWMPIEKKEGEHPSSDQDMN